MSDSEVGLRRSLEEQWCVRVHSDHPAGDACDGVVLALHPELVVLREEDDFEFDGVVVLPRRSVRSVRDDEYERASNAILRHNGQLERLAETPAWMVRSTSLLELLAGARRHDVWPGVECLQDDDGTGFYLGPVTGLADDSFFQRCYDAAGAWEREYEIDYEAVLRVELDSRYTRHFNAFMRSRDARE